MRQTAMWLTVIGFSLIVYGRIQLFRQYTEVLTSLRGQIDKTEKKVALPYREGVDISELEDRLRRGVGADGQPLSDAQKIQLYQELVTALRNRVDVLKEQITVADSVHQLPTRIMEMESHARIPEGVGFVLTVVGLATLIAVSVLGPSKDDTEGSDEGDFSASAGTDRGRREEESPVVTDESTI